MMQKDEGETLDAYLADKVFKGETGTSMDPDAKDVEGFNRFIERYQAGLSIERAAVADLK